MKILLTGGTGFIGSHLVEYLLERGHELILTKRSHSSLQNCDTFIGKVSWVDIYSVDWISLVCDFEPEIIVHAAWNGVTAGDRDNWPSQLSNINFMSELLYIGEKCQVKKIIALGSQAEYGLFSSPVSEDSPVYPISKYGVLKLAVLHQLQSFCQLNNIKWYWLRIFSVFGEKEGKSWLIPNVITTLLNGAKDMDISLGEQEYAYLYINELSDAVCRVVEKDGKSGIYNLSSARPLPIKYIVNFIREKINPSFKFNFGAIPYRDNQSMFIAGDSRKFINTYGVFENGLFEQYIENVISYFKK